MKTTLLFLLLAVTTAFAQQDTTQLKTQAADTVQQNIQAPAPAPEPVAEAASSPQKVYYGMTLGMNFGDYFRISVQPMIGYTFTPKLSGGLKFAYEYIEDKRYDVTYTGSNYGGSVFARYRVIPQAYLHTEFAYMSYGAQTYANTSERFGVPFLLVGGGLVQRVGSSVSMYAEVLVDVLQDDKSPYEDWTPWVSVGASVGF
jgi:hypothetical protein